MKGFISGIKRMEIHDGEGIRTTVFFKGCPLKCVWCHNPESISFQPQIAHFPQKCIACRTCEQVCAPQAIAWEENAMVIHREKCNLCGECENACPTSAFTLFGKECHVSELAEELIVDKPFFEQSGGGVTLSGGECLAQPHFALAITKALHAQGIRVNIDTCGFVQTSVLEELLPFVDTFLYDIKAIDATLHKRLTGQENALILHNLAFLLARGAKVEIRFPLVVGLNDCETEKIGEFLSKFKNPPPVKVLKYHALAGSRYLALGLKNTLPNATTTLEEMDRAVFVLQAHGIVAINGAKQA